MDLLKNKKLFLLDMDGTIYIDNKLFDGSKAFLEAIKRKGGKYVFVTNNSSKGIDDYIRKLGALGVDAGEDDFSTSSQATIEYLLKHHQGKKIYVLGTASLKDEMRKHRINVVDTYQPDIDCLTVGFDRELKYSKLEDACRILARDVDYIATNPDIVCPVEFGYVPDCGSICQMLYNAVFKRPKFIGKPEPEMVYYVMNKTGFTKDQTVIVGDRIYTDILCGVNAGVTSVLVLSGETTKEDVDKSDIKPDFVFDDVNQLEKEL